MSDETATAAPVTEPAPAATGTEAPKPEDQAKPAPDWEVAYKGLQTSLNKRDRHIDNILLQNQTLMGAVEALKGDLDVVLKQTVGEDGLKARQAERAIAQERSQALAAADTAKQFIPAAIDVMASTMRAAGVAEQDIQAVFLAAKDTANVAEWSEATKSGTVAALAKAKAAESAKIESAVKAKSQEEIEVEANGLAERTLRTKGIDKVDLGRGQRQNPQTSFIERVRSIDRNTPDGEAEFQKIRKDVARGTLQI